MYAGTHRFELPASELVWSALEKRKMPPRNVDTDIYPADDEGNPTIAPVVTEETYEQKRPPHVYVWRNILWFIYLHFSSLIGICLLPQAYFRTWLWTLALFVMGGLGVTAGAHRLWAHKSYKAKLPLRIVLTIFNTMAFQNHVIEWSRDHRCHHKFSETDADPHNAKRGFFFSHMGWLCVKKHPDVKARGKTLDLGDLEADPCLRFQRKFYVPLVVFLGFVVPVAVPWYFWGESAILAYHLCSMLRYCIILHATWCVNSVAHLWGNKPYDKYINPVENAFVAVGALGEGFHNYHHTFPYDYSTSEFGWKCNPTTLFIDLMAKIGQVTERKTVPLEMVMRRKERTGDGTEGFGIFEKKKSD